MVMTKSIVKNACLGVGRLMRNTYYKLQHLPGFQCLQGFQSLPGFQCLQGFQHLPERRMLPMMGKQNAAVLPEPVCAHAIMSRPASPMGME